MHHQVAQKTPVLVQVLAGFGSDTGIVSMVMVVIESLARCHLVVHAVQTGGHGDNDCCNGQRIEEGRQHCSYKREQERQHDL